MFRITRQLASKAFVRSSPSITSTLHRAVPFRGFGGVEDKRANDEIEHPSCERGPLFEKATLTATSASALKSESVSTLESESEVEVAVMDSTRLDMINPAYYPTYTYYHNYGVTSPPFTDVDANFYKELEKELRMKQYSGASAVKAGKGKKGRMIEGILYKHRWVLPMRVGEVGDGEGKGGVMWVFFVVVTGSPRCWLSKETSKRLNIPEGDVRTVTIEGVKHELSRSPSDSQFENVNILGTDFMFSNRVSLSMRDDKVTIVINANGNGEGERAENEVDTAKAKEKKVNVSKIKMGKKG